MVKQCQGLADALSKIQEFGSTIASDGKTDTNDQTVARHGDVKASNILWFAANDSPASLDQSKLVLADFGLGHDCNDDSIPRPDPAPAPFSPQEASCQGTFEAPELIQLSENGLYASVMSDVWSLGCTFLEFVTWYLMGWDAVKTGFVRARQETDDSRLVSDSFFRVSQGIAEIKPGIVEWMQGLKSYESCTPLLRDFVEVIEEDVLVADPERRITARILSERLRSMEIGHIKRAFN
jgi:serine/threonine protein kinase